MPLGVTPPRGFSSSRSEMPGESEKGSLRRCRFQSKIVFAASGSHDRLVATIVGRMAKKQRKPMTNSKKLTSADLAKVQGGKISKSTAARVPTAAKGRAAGSAAKATNLGTKRR
jgi:hypothetical protein